MLKRALWEAPYPSCWLVILLARRMIEIHLMVKVDTLLKKTV